MKKIKKQLCIGAKKQLSMTIKRKIDQIVIVKSAKCDILKDLELMNISNSYLYSGVERAAMNIKGKRAEWINK